MCGWGNGQGVGGVWVGGGDVGVVRRGGGWRNPHVVVFECFQGRGDLWVVAALCWSGVGVRASGLGLGLRI